MTSQNNQSQMLLQELVTDILKQNNLLIQQNNQLIQINNEQNAQINELLIQLESDDDEPKQPQYLDD